MAVHGRLVPGAGTAGPAGFGCANSTSSSLMHGFPLLRPLRGSSSCVVSQLAESGVCYPVSIAAETELLAAAIAAVSRRQHPRPLLQTEQFLGQRSQESLWDSQNVPRHLLPVAMEIRF